MAFNPQTINKELDMANLAKHNTNYSAIKTELDAHDTHVAAQTAHGSTSAATAGKIMQRDSAGRAKVAAPSESDDIARKAEVDAVQTNLDEHEVDSVAHLSTSDREKLDGLEVGAEANQNAFSQVNNVIAGVESDTLTIAGGTGITVSTNPTTKTLTVSATGEATPGAHGSSHNNDGADPIPDLVELRDEFDALTPAGIGAETPAGAQAKVDALAGPNNTKTVSQISDEVSVVSTRLTDLSINIYSFGAVGDGVTDDTLAIQSAIDFASSKGGGLVVCPPSLTGYLIAGTLVLKRFVELSGVFFMQGDKYADHMENISGTTFLITGGEGETTGQTIQMQTGSTIKNIKFFYPTQSKTSVVKAFPPTIKLLPSGGNDCTIENVFLTNSYYGIDATGAHERLTIKSVKGQPIFGIRVHENYDVDRFDDIHFYPYWSQDISDTASYASVCLYDGVGIEINRSDNIQITKYFVYGYKHGLHLKSGSYGTMDNSGFDYCWRAVTVEDGGINTNGWYISTTTFVSGDYQRGVSGVGIDISGDTAVMGGLHLSNCGFWSGNNGQSNITGNRGQVIAANCRFNSWLGSQSIYIAKDFGVQLSNCVFSQTGTHIAYDASATKGAVVVGTRAAGNLNVYNPNNLVQYTAANAPL